MKTTSNAVEILNRLADADGETQAELAARVGTRPWVIARLEDADYEGHTLDMLARIAHSLDQRVEVRLVPRQTETATAAA